MWLRLAAAALSFLTLLGAEDGSAIVLDGTRLWTIKVPRGAFTAAQRAEDIRTSIIALAENRRRDLADVLEVHTEAESILLVGRVYVFSVTREDGQAEGHPVRELFAERRSIALDAVRRYRETRTLSFLIHTGILALAALALCAVSLILLRYVNQRLHNALNRLAARVSESSRDMSAVYRVIERPLTHVAATLLQALFLCSAAGIGVLTVSYVIGLFPDTARFSEIALASSSNATWHLIANIFSYLPNLVILGIVFGFTYALIKVASALAGAVNTGSVTIPRFYREWAQPTYSLIRVILIMFALVVAFPYLPGGDSPALRGVSIFIGVLVSLGSGSAMGNVIAGLILTYMRPFQVGDRVKISDSVGDVTEKAILVTRIRTIKNVEVIVPNSAILGAHIVNYSANARDRGLIGSTSVTIGYDAPWQRVSELLISAALKTPHVLADPQPFVFQTSLNDFHVTYEINAFTRQANEMAFIYSELHKNIQEEFNAGGIEIMSPTYLSLRDGNTTTIPEQHRPSGYVSPAFHVRSQGARASVSSTASAGTSSAG